MSEVRVRLTGEQAELGQVPAGDVARLIIEVETALRRVAAAIIGRPKGAAGGRYTQSIEEATRLLLVRVEPGSVVPVLELPDHASEGETLELDDEPLGDAALSALLAATEPTPHTNPVVAAAVLGIANEIKVGERYDAVEIEVAANGRPRRRARIDGSVRQRLRSYVDQVVPAARQDIVVGNLFEANFERDTARLRSPTGQVVEVQFDEEHADDIQAALRQQATLRGEVAYDPKDHVVRSVHLREVVRGEQMVLGLDAEDFWRAHTFAELATLQGAGEPIDPDALYDVEATEDERDAFMAALADLD